MLAKLLKRRRASPPVVAVWPKRQAAVAGIKAPAAPSFKNPFRPAHSAASPPAHPKHPHVAATRVHQRFYCARTNNSPAKHLPDFRALPLSHRHRSSFCTRARPDPSISRASASTRSLYRQHQAQAGIALGVLIPLELDSCPPGHDRHKAFAQSAPGLIGLKISCHRYGQPPLPKPCVQGRDRPRYRAIRSSRPTVPVVAPVHSSDPCSQKPASSRVNHSDESIIFSSWTLLSHIRRMLNRPRR